VFFIYEKNVFFSVLTRTGRHCVRPGIESPSKFFPTRRQR